MYRPRPNVRIIISEYAKVTSTSLVNEMASVCNIVDCRIKNDVFVGSIASYFLFLLKRACLF